MTDAGHPDDYLDMQVHKVLKDSLPGDDR